MTVLKPTRISQFSAWRRCDAPLVAEPKQGFLLASSEMRMLSNTFFLWPLSFYLSRRRKLARKAPERALLADPWSRSFSLDSSSRSMQARRPRERALKCKKASSSDHFFPTQELLGICILVGEGLPDLPAIGKNYRVIDRKYWTTRVRPPNFSTGRVMPIWSGGPPESHAPSGYTSRRMSWPMILLG